ncbi:restriction endonuclease subunit S [Paenibacillus sacheonensis]|uniref:Type I restriction modification DNA specificity domain-containing protein n=1 Tax=Paenibacillus sacheonensis TaxID=742054 RepID=A0A7X4YSM6_9BACL|nr:restriction endonuclease subunit S [Paenibacillus sacheonensis]MBM7567929.1 type I restriction enzyme S subunit [Paenibacillus sacheonensis]NBC70814.1 hypothetical protein [Paenibacillus sacheonensis]
MSLNLNKSSWKRIKFGDVVRNVNETIRDATAVGIDRVIAMEHMKPGELQIKRWGMPEDGTTFTRRVRPGQTLFGKRRAYQRKVAYAEFEAVCSSDILTFEADETQLLPGFLPFIVQSNEFFDYALGTSVGSLSPRTNWRDLANFEFDLPPIDEQKRIADLLWAIEHHRMNVATLVNTSSRVKSSLLIERLERGVKQQNWPAEPVTAIVKSGPTNGKSVPPNDQQRGVPTLSISAIRDGGVRGGDSVKWVDVDPTSVGAFQIQKNDFLIVRGNGNRSLTGQGGLVSDDLPNGCIYPDLLIRLRFDEERMLPTFGAEQWNSANVHAALLKNAKSTNGIWKINGKDIKSHRLVVPPIPDQLEMLKELAAFNSATESAHTEYQALTTLRSTLFIDIFGGNN